MGWQDRPYYRDQSPGAGNPLMWVLNGSVPLLTIFGIRVRMHASLILTIAIVLIFGLGGMGFTVIDRVQSMTMLFVIVLLHEFGHCFACRMVGGTAEDILMTPLGGLAFASPPRRPWPTFVTVAGGPLVNVLICGVCWAIMSAMTGWATHNPLMFHASGATTIWSIYGYVLWAYQMSMMLLLFNLLPIFPLDGGQLLQSILWVPLGYYRSMMIMCIVGMIGSVLLGMLSLATMNLWLLLIWVSCFMSCYQMRLQLKQAGPYGFANEPDYSSSLYDSENTIRRKLNKRSIKRAQKRERQDRIEQRKIDSILAKVSAQGMHSLTWWERRTLRKATERQREAEVSSGKRSI